MARTQAEKTQTRTILLLGKNGQVGWELERVMPRQVSHFYNPLACEDYPVPATRPNYSRPGRRAQESSLNLQLPDWEQGVKRMLLKTSKEPS